MRSICLSYESSRFNGTIFFLGTCRCDTFHTTGKTFKLRQDICNAITNQCTFIVCYVFWIFKILEWSLFERKCVSDLFLNSKSRSIKVNDSQVTLFGRVRFTKYQSITAIERYVFSFREDTQKLSRQGSISNCLFQFSRFC